MKVLVTGGAGYVGSVLTRILISKGFRVRVIDALKHGGESILEMLNSPNFEFVKADIRDAQTVKKAVKDIDAVVHLAAVVGDPACKKYPQLAKEVNLDASIQLYELANNSKVRRFVFVSTCSNYGRMNGNEMVDENSPLNPVSLYAETKVKVEEFLLSDKRAFTKPTILRFATAYGISPRMRFDLTVNEFTKELALGRELIVYGEQFWRPYCHVVDLARSILLVLNSDERVSYNVYNVGDTRENYRKQMIVEEIRKQISNGKIKYVKKDEDPRDYKVSFEKIKKDLNFEITKRVPDGISQILFALRNNLIGDPDDKKYRNS